MSNKHLKFNLVKLESLIFPLKYALSAAFPILANSSPELLQPKSLSCPQLCFSHTSHSGYCGGSAFKYFLWQLLGTFTPVIWPVLPSSFSQLIAEALPAFLLAFLQLVLPKVHYKWESNHATFPLKTLHGFPFHSADAITSVAIRCYVISPSHPNFYFFPLFS